MITAKAFAGKHYAVYGLARSGLATVEALLASGAKVTAWDGKEEARILPGTGRGTIPHSEMVEGSRDASSSHAEGPLHHPADGPPPRTGEDLIIADLDTADLSQFDSLVVTPGLPLNRHPIAARARAANLEIIGDIELFARARAELPPHKVVGITGTNGKSTTTALVHHILQTAGVPSLMGGNIGLPILSQDPLPEGGVYVLELSSYQIDLTQSLDCDVAVLLNITPDHLDRYDGFEAYAASKARLFEMQSEREIFGRVFVTDDPETARAASRWERSFTVGEKWLSQRDPAYLSLQSHWPALQGPHNACNAAAAITVARWPLEIDWIPINHALRTYPGLPHRLERIREKDGVLFVNDSKATNATATAPALAAFPAIRWICGGQAKADNLDECAPFFGNVRTAYTIGEASDLFARLLAPHIKVAECGDLAHAVLRAAHDAQPGETVLLSPACASFDQFTDFEARGDAFRRLVGGL
ncbi:UDP-N-acetylmuramoyl-L-alanine--D-glutamate ligase [Sphingomonas sp. RB1R13]|uniref:UDP-N-acetylmuramoyl-L-alanine--D-glutamate ligase n=1 Tax=Sphingomonas sp. RB1R13 TaxID=3096159 RepID=UPI002FC957AD